MDFEAKLKEVAIKQVAAFDAKYRRAPTEIIPLDGLKTVEIYDRIRTIISKHHKGRYELAKLIFPNYEELAEQGVFPSFEDNEGRLLAAINAFELFLVEAITSGEAPDGHILPEGSIRWWRGPVTYAPYWIVPDGSPDYSDGDWYLCFSPEVTDSTHDHSMN